MVTSITATGRSFGTVWQIIHQTYLDNADALVVPPAQIQMGPLGLIGPAPSVYTYMIPGRDETGAAGLIGSWARLKTLCTVPAAVDLPTGMQDAVALAGRAIRLLKSLRHMGLQWDGVAPVFEAADAELVVVSFEVMIPYDPMAE